MADQQRLRLCPSKPRVLIISDIGNEPDDSQSLVRYLLYSNEFDTRGLVACTSTWLRSSVHPEHMTTIVDGYSQVVDNLNAHVHPDNQYSSAQFFHSIIKSGPPLYGKQALEDGVPLSDGAALLIQSVDESEDPLWVLGWGGINVLAQALQHAQRSKSASDFTQFRSKLRVYTISDQDDTGTYIRTRFPDVFYICSVHGWNQYGNAAWTGISGDLVFNMNKGGPDPTIVDKPWLKQHIQIGPLGKTYPDSAFIMEGDTPTFLYLIQNGLGHSEHPEWGSWGGRYALSDLGGWSKHYADASDEVIGTSGEKYTTNQATVWRWRADFQASFAARMQWSLTRDRRSANHAPVVVVNDSTPGPEPLLIDAEAGTEITLDASRSYDPDGDTLGFEWFQYKEPSAAQTPIFWDVPSLEIKPTNAEQTVVTIALPPPEKCAANVVTGEALGKGLAFHFILRVTDDGTPKLTTYKRVVVQATNEALAGGRDRAFETVATAMGHV